MSEQRFIYGYGATKHISSGEFQKDGYDKGREMALCGAHGGYPRDEPDRPTCKRCEKKASKT